MQYVAIKIIEAKDKKQANFFKQQYQLFEEEKLKDSQYILQIKHIQMTQIDNYCTTSIFTDLYQGQLSELFEQKLSKKQIIIIMIQLLIGLEELKQAKMLHNNITPYKILYNHQNGNYNIKINGSYSALQFKDEEYVYDLERVGTRKYISPDILNEEMISYKDDIYSLGLVFMELLFGKEFDYQTEIRLLRNGNHEILQRRPQIEHRDFDQNDDYLIENIIQNMIQKQRKSSDELLNLIFRRYLMELDFSQSLDYYQCLEKIKSLDDDDFIIIGLVQQKKLEIFDIKGIKIIYKYLKDLEYQCLQIKQQEHIIIKAKLKNSFLQIECCQKKNLFLQKYQQFSQIFQERSFQYVVTIINILHQNLKCDYLLVIIDNYEGDLRDLIPKKISKKDIISIIIQLLLGMAELRSMRILHSDIKPSNILFNYKNGNIHIKISGYNFAKFLIDKDYVDDLEGCTHKYCAPEIFDEDSWLDDKYDIYSLGIVFIELLFGRFLELNDTRLLRKGQMNIQKPNRDYFIYRDFNEIDIFLIEKVIKNMICVERKKRYYPKAILELILEFFQLNNSTNNQYDLREIDNQRFEIIDEETQIQIRSFLVENCGARFYPITQEEIIKAKEEFEQRKMTLQKVINLKCKEFKINSDIVQEQINYLESIKCQCLDIIGKGSFGLVLKAIYQDKIVAIKIIEAENEEHAQKLKLEQQFLEKLQDSKYILNLRKTLDVKLSSPLIFIFTDLCQGELTDLINKNIPKKQIVSIIIQLLIGLEELKSLKILHVDIKPQNILYNYKKGNYQVKIADFGQSKQLRENEYTRDLSRGGGTQKYASKEILEDNGYISYKTDVYSLGIVFIELIFGRYFDREKEIRPLRQGKLDILSERPRVENRSFDKIDDFIIEKIIKNMIQQNQDERKYSDELLSLIFKQYLQNYDHIKIIGYDECLSQGDNQVKGDCSNIIVQNNFDSSSKNCFYPINIIQIIKLQEIICALANDQIQQISQINPNLIFPSLNCQNIRTLYPGASYYGTGGDNCDYTQPIVFNFNSSPYYAQRMFFFPTQWVFSLCDNCPTITSSLSINDLVPISLHSPKYLYISAEKLCDYFDTNFIFDNLNQLVTKISFTPGFFTKYIEQLYILIFKCPLGCSSCDSSLLNCQSCAVGYYLVEILAQNVTLIAQLVLILLLFVYPVQQTHTYLLINLVNYAKIQECLLTLVIALVVIKVV
ncbi:hypothetical protein ABPG72_018382 [Tetrahymena utriculariae]